MTIYRSLYYQHVFDFVQCKCFQVTILLIHGSFERSIFTTSLKYCIFYQEGVYLLWNLIPNTLSGELLHSYNVLGSFKYLPYKLAKSRYRLTMLMFLNYDKWRGYVDINNSPFISHSFTYIRSIEKFPWTCMRIRCWCIKLLP